MTLQIGVYDAETDQYIVRDMTAEEFEKHQSVIDMNAEIQQEISTKDANRAALLSKLGITAEEAKLLLG